MTIVSMTIASDPIGARSGIHMYGGGSENLFEDPMTRLDPLRLISGGPLPSGPATSGRRERLDWRIC